MKKGKTTFSILDQKRAEAVKILQEQYGFPSDEDFINTRHTDCNNVTHDGRKDVTTMTKREWQASCKNG